MRVLIVLLGCVAAALAHGTATAAPAATATPVAGGGAEAVRTEATLGRGIGANIRIGGGRGRWGGGRWGRGYGRGYGFGRFGGWVYPGVAEQVVVTEPTAYGYGLGYYGGGTTYVQQPPVVVAQQPPQVVVAQQPAQVVYTQAAPPETALVPGGSFVAASAPAVPTGGFVASAAAPAPASTTYTQTTTATEPGAAGFIATAAPAASGFVAQTGPTVVAAQAPTVVAAAPSASYVTAESLVPGLTYASPYFFGAGSPVVYSRYLGGPTSWYAFRGRRFGRRFGRGVFGVYPYGYGSGGMIYGGGTGILGNILGGVTGGLPPIYVGGRIGGGRFGGRFGGFGGRGGGHGGGHGGGRRHLEQEPPTTGQTGQVGKAQSLHQIGNVESLPTTTIPSANPSADIMQLGGAQTNEPAPTEPQKPQAIMSAPMPTASVTQPQY